MPSLNPSPVDFDETWHKIKSTLKSLITLSVVPRREWNERFSDVYTVCVSNQDGLDEVLYKATKKFFEDHAKDIFVKINSSGKSKLLHEYYRLWNQYKNGSLYINTLYSYLNKHYPSQSHSDFVEHIQVALPDAEIMETGQVALETWKSKVIKKLQDDLISALLNEVKRDRKGDRPSETIVHGVISSFIDVQTHDSKNLLKLYQSTFEEQLLAETADYYSNESQQLLQSCDCSQYMQKVDVRLAEENLRVRRFFHISTYDKVIKVAQLKLVQDHQNLLTTECRLMLEDKRLVDLLRMYKLLKPLPKAFDAMLVEFQEFISETGLNRVKYLHIENETGQFVNVLLDLHKEYTAIIESTFNSDQAFFCSRDKACTKIVNHRFDTKKPCRAPELLAKYCDSLLKKSTKNLPDGEIEDKLTNVITIFKYLDDKDVFQKFYSKLLAKRLIHGMSISMDAEEGMITKLKLACGYEYTNKLHRMFTDMAISTDLNSQFSKFLDSTKSQLGINFSLLVLQSGAWPLGQAVAPTVVLPGELCKSVQMFESFYNNLHSGRKLNWLQHLSNGEIKLTYLKKQYIITCTTYQMAVLLLFNENDSLTYEEISNICQLDDKELKRTLQSVVDVKLLNKQDTDTKVVDTTFLINNEFSNKRTKFKITAAVQKETPQEVEQTHSAVDEDRKMYTQAAIVRIMKSRKALKHNILIQEVVDQSRSKFSPTTTMIKKCIEALIEKNYIERLKGTRDEYSYVA